MLSTVNSLDPLLKRPFSLYRWLGQDFQILYKVVGRLTNILKDKKPHDTVEIIGPLGNGFPIIKGKDKPILIGGGLGSVPLFALAESIIQQSQIPPRPPLSKPWLVEGRWEDFKPVFFIGAKTRREVLYIDALKSIRIKPIVSTDDGSLGQKGTVLSVFNKFLTSNFSVLSSHLLYACGPKPMLQELSHITKKHSLTGYIALEENMACGIGACLSCVVNTIDGFKRVCKEGPVFSMEEIIW